MCVTLVRQDNAGENMREKSGVRFDTLPSTGQLGSPEPFGCAPLSSSKIERVSSKIKRFTCPFARHARACMWFRPRGWVCSVSAKFGPAFGLACDLRYPMPVLALQVAAAVAVVVVVVVVRVRAVVAELATNLLLLGSKALTVAPVQAPTCTHTPLLRPGIRMLTPHQPQWAVCLPSCPRRCEHSDKPRWLCWQVSCSLCRHLKNRCAGLW